MNEMKTLSDKHGNTFSVVDETARTLGLTGTAAGKIVRIKSVDSSGKPTQWEAADMPQGGGSGDYTLPMASPGELGGVKAVLASSNDNAVVHITADGELRVAVPTDDRINELIDAKLGPVENALSALADRAEEVSA